MDGASAGVARSLGRSFAVVLFFGLASVVLGVLLMVFTEQSVVFFAVITGIYLILAGLFMIVASFQTDTGGTEGTGMRVFSAVAGLLAVILGIADLIEGIANPGMPAHGWVTFIGGLSLAAGIVVLAWPAITINSLVWVTGLWLVFPGIVEVFASFQLRKLAETV
ncbi:MAG: DUF308 domain-containing protein [Actinomycetia bacterium]|nr:DUF308 domain-containing protein [Actinomycetes bacterium]